MHAQLWWSGHVVCMDGSRHPKALLYRQLKSGQRPAGRPMKRFKDVLKSYLRRCNIDRTTWETAAQARSSWHRTGFAGVSEFENNRIVALQEKRARRKENQFINNAANNTAHVCLICGRQCAAVIGLVTSPMSQALSLIRRPRREISTNSVEMFHDAELYDMTCAVWCSGEL